MNKLLITLALLVSTSAFASQQCDSLAKYKAIQAEGRAFSETEGFWVETKLINTPDEAVEFFAPLCARSKLPNPRFGMSAKTVREKTNWGAPDEINRTMTARGTHEQWVYSRGYLYFDNGILTAAQN